MKGSKRRGRRPGTWELRLDAGVDPLNGRRLQRSITFHGTAREADLRLAELSVEKSHGRISGGSHTVAEVLEAGLDQARAEGLERTTLRGYRRVAECQIAPALGAKRVSRLTVEEIDRFYRALVKKGYSHSTIHQTHIVLRRVLDTAVRWGWISHNPARDARPPRVARAQPKPVPVEVIPVLIAEAARSNPDLAACIALAADTGARRGELCALRWTSVDLDAGKVRFERSIGEDGAAYEKDTKNHQHRLVSLSPQATDMLRQHRTMVVARALAAGTGLVEDAFVFSGAPDGSEHWWPSNLNGSFRRLRQRAGLPDWVKLHGLRHTQVTELLDAGVPVRTVSGRVGHLNPSTTTNIYSHWVPQSDERAADVVASRIWDRQRGASERPH
ncbi:MAG: tyrosine-type recombinase/integrase [Vicinamibacterales bacterium]